MNIKLHPADRALGYTDEDAQPLHNFRRQCAASNMSPKMTQDLVVRGADLIRRVADGKTVSQATLRANLNYVCQQHNFDYDMAAPIVDAVFSGEIPHYPGPTPQMHMDTIERAEALMKSDYPAYQRDKVLQENYLQAKAAEERGWVHYDEGGVHSDGSDADLTDEGQGIGVDDGGDDVEAA